MDISAVLVAECPPATLYRWVHDLADYPVWLDLVHRAAPDQTAADSAPAWMVELRARVGPFARSKRLRMVRTDGVDGKLVRFERRELDGHTHSSWVLQAELTAVTTLAATATTASTTLTMSLHYGGGLWTGAVLERVLHEQINRGHDSLKALVEQPTSTA